jgi:hypothetical protein
MNKTTEKVDRQIKKGYSSRSQEVTNHTVNATGHKTRKGKCAAENRVLETVPLYSM